MVTNLSLQVVFLEVSVGALSILIICQRGPEHFLEPCHEVAGVIAVRPYFFGELKKLLRINIVWNVAPVNPLRLQAFDELDALGIILANVHHFVFARDSVKLNELAEAFNLDFECVLNVENDVLGFNTSDHLHRNKVEHIIPHILVVP